MAPEAFDPDSFGGISPQADIWSAGCVLLEMLTGHAPFDKIPMQQIMMKVVVKKEAPQIATSIPANVASLLRRCFVYEPEDRWQAAELFDAVHELVLELQTRRLQPEAPPIKPTIASCFGSASPSRAETPITNSSGLAAASKPALEKFWQTAFCRSPAEAPPAPRVEAPNNEAIWEDHMLQHSQLVG